MAPPSVCSDTQQTLAADAKAVVTAFICANCARPSQDPECVDRTRPSVPDFGWPFPVEEILVGCAGRIQPEHILKSFESGASLVSVIACGEDNCHYLEGSKRCARRVDFLRSVLDEIGLGGERLMLFNLPGTAAEDTAVGAGMPTPVCGLDDEDPRLAAIRDEVSRALAGLNPNPLFHAPVAIAAEETYQEMDTSDDDNDE